MSGHDPVAALTEGSSDHHRKQPLQIFWTQVSSPLTAVTLTAVALTAVADGGSEVPGV